MAVGRIRRTTVRAAVALMCLALLAAACDGEAVPAPPAPPEQPPAQTGESGARDVVTDLGVPWGIAFLPDGSALIAERDSGMIKQLSEPGVVRDVGAVEGVAARGEGGLLGLATAGDTVFAYHTTATDNRVVRMDFDGQALGPPAPILTGIPTGGSRHDGGRIAFGPDGRLYVATGEIGDPPLAQDRSSLAGKILRINPDGSIPADNPDPQSPVWSFGHRNVQGLAWDPGGRLWATEYGADTWDELNLIEPGGNYGWPVAEGRQEMPGMIDPVLQWRPAEASPSGLAFWDGALWIANLRGQRLLEVPVRADGELGEPVSRFVGEYGRLRTVVAAPDGSLWFTTSNRDGRGVPRSGDDRILRYRR
ncbi:oxidoreductase [Mycolicibacterium thermoresistibile ATCC 19527]|uniref:Oxidoreductase n=1 Tax=Mycolicibacterium thermoresistibile (strain ATCC 19527 / DSM 44167 / CIP 105390 / JCM 6362 / NCTC 10409 / 316) TaxID=1078020 RepID=G7CH58_MYCT3|nr:PQQ-dependent sugar dehydrogenase [Mycolicibacterium thermoresistibile]EHI12168.1 oxidoreductase [Mycolicibacterium thermoresistibile ATCC 19527]